MSQNYRAAFSIYEKQNEDLQECLIDVFSSHKSLSGFFKKLSPLLDKKGRNDPETLDAIYVLARECDGLGRHDDAEKLYSEVVRGRMEKSRYDPATLEAAVSLATALRRNRRHDEAIAWYGEVLDILINLHSASEPIALATAFQLGSVMEEVGYYDDARQWYENVLEKQMENPKLGPGHPNTLNTSHGLASVLGKLGDYEGAELWYVETLNGMLKVLGKSHPDTRSTWWELQLLCNRRGRNQTLENCRKALDSAPEQAPQTSESKITTVTVKEISVYSGDDTVGAETRYAKWEQIMENSASADPDRATNRALLFDSYGSEDDFNGQTKFGADSWIKDYTSYLDKQIDPLSELRGAKNHRIKVAILDTGLDLNHSSLEDFKDRIQGKNQKNFVNDGQKNVQDHDGHGTHVAGLFLKLAECTELFIARISSDRRVEKDEVVAEAIRWAIGQRVDIINMSFGYEDRIDDIDDAIKEAVRQDIIIFAAAANHGARNKIAWPAKSSHVICVHASDGFGSSSTFTPASSDGMLNFAILGEAVESFWISDSGKQDKHDTMKRKSGTSFAAPILAAYCATILYYIRLKFSPERQRLITYARTKEGMVAILGHPGLVDRRKSPGYSVVIPWGLLKATSLHDQLVERLEGKGRHTG